MAGIIASAGYDFVEWGVGPALKPRDSEEAFKKSWEDMRSAEVSFSALNCFVPGDLKITGPDVDDQALQDFVRVVMKRAERTEVETIVFGSGGARSIPEGFDRAEAHEHLVSFAGMAASIAHDHGITIVVEPLSKEDCNVLTTVAECGDLVREVDHPACRLLVDSYHHMRDDDSFEDIVEYGDLLAHIHIATVPNRRPPGAEPCDFTPFFEALQEVGYDGRISIEGNIPTPEEDLPKALEVMESYVG